MHSYIYLPDEICFELYNIPIMSHSYRKVIFFTYIINILLDFFRAL